MPDRRAIGHGDSAQSNNNPQPDDSDDRSDDDYEPEYEEEIVRIGGHIALHVLSLLPPPLEFLSSLRSEHKEISGRQVWTGSLLLANVLVGTQDYQGFFDNKQILELGSGTGDCNVNACMQIVT